MHRRCGSVALSLSAVRVTPYTVLRRVMTASEASASATTSLQTPLPAAESAVGTATATSSSATATTIPPASASKPIQVPGGAQIAEANTPLAEQHQRIEMKYNRANNLLLYGIVAVPFIAFPLLYHYKFRYMWSSYTDPYALPAGFDPNRDPPPVDGGASSNAHVPKSMMSGAAPGSYNVKPAIRSDQEKKGASPS